jgi:hypothetical protein
LNGLFSENAYYFIGGPYNDEIKAGEYIFGDEDMYMYLLTLEEFLEEYPFKIGDKVVDGYGNLLTIKAMSWSEDCETIVYDFEDAVIVLAAEDLKPVDDEDDDNKKPTKMKNVLAELLEHIKTTPKEDLEREFEEIAKWTNVGPTVEEFRAFCECVNKKLVYPDNYEECVRIAKNIHGYDINIDAPAYGELLESFVKLLICRDAYWKIYGKEMSLDGPWEPAAQDTIWGITRSKDEIEKYSCRYGRTRSLEFPTEAMRDIFYENFKDLIERCKEIL